MLILILDDAAKLRQFIEDSRDEIIVSVWYKHQRYNRGLNERNLLTTGSLKKGLNGCQASSQSFDDLRGNTIVYAEADLSDYNHDEAESFWYLANQWNIDLKPLANGPLVMVMKNGDGQIFWGNQDTPTSKLLQRINAEIVKLQGEDIKLSKGVPRDLIQNLLSPNNQDSIDIPCKLLVDESDVIEFARSDPWDDHVEISKQVKPQARTVAPKYHLKEPEKSFAHI